MNKTYLLSADSLKTMAQGALGAMTFGMYHQYTTNKMMEMNNEQMKSQNKVEIDRIQFQHQYSMDKMESHHKADMDKMEAQHKAEMYELRTKMAALERRRWW